MKKVVMLTALIIILTLLAPSVTAMAESGSSAEIVLQIDNPNMLVNGKTARIDEQGSRPILIDGRTMLPIRSVVEALGGTVGWLAETKTVTISLDGTNIEMVIDSKAITVNGQTRQIDVAPQIVNSRTMVPLRFVVENLGFNAVWNGDTQTIVVTEGANSQGEYTRYLDYLKKNGYLFLKSMEYNITLKYETGSVYGDNYPVPPDYKLPLGVIGMKTADFDGDGNSEMLVILSGQTKTDEYGYEYNVLSALMLKQQNGVVREAGKCVFDVAFLPGHTNEGYGDVFIKRVGGRLLICCEVYTEASVWADGISWTMMAFTYENGAFVSILNENISGSEFSDSADHIRSMEKAIWAAGITSIDLTGWLIDWKDGTRTIDVEGQIEVISSIKYGPSGSIEAFFDALYAIYETGSRQTLSPIVIDIYVTNI